MLEYYLDQQPHLFQEAVRGQLERIKAAVKANFLFQHLNEQQSKQVYDVMKRVAVKKGDETLITAVCRILEDAGEGDSRAAVRALKSLQGTT